MKTLKSFNFLGIIAIILFTTSCREPKLKQIYGSFVGEVTRIDTQLSTSEQVYTVIESAILTLAKTKDGMNVEISGEKLTQEFLLLDPEVSGTSSYKYTYKTDDGSIVVSIISPDFDNVTLNAIILLEDQDLKVEYSFKGKRK